jgi:transcription antitermination factor NusG
MNNVAEMAGACSASLRSVVTTPTFPWFALCVREKMRAITEESLLAHEYEIFSPVRQEVRQWSDRKKTFDIPLFPGYLLCRFDPQRFLPILKTPGVIGLVKTGNRLIPADEDEVRAVQLAVGAGVNVEPLPNLVVGQRVIVVRGPMSGTEGVLTEIRSQLKLVLGVSMMNRSVAVEIDRLSIAPI